MHNGSLVPVSSLPVLQKKNRPSLKMSLPSSREGTVSSRAPMQTRRPGQRCRSRLLVATVRGSRVFGRARWGCLGARGREQSRQIHLPMSSPVSSHSSTFLPQSGAPTFGGRNVERLSEEEQDRWRKQAEQGCPSCCVDGGGSDPQPRSWWRIVVGHGWRRPNPRSRKPIGGSGAGVPHIRFPQRRHGGASFLHWCIWWRCLPRRCDGSIVVEQWFSIPPFTIYCLVGSGQR
jgi:hypothetical protein